MKRLLVLFLALATALQAAVPLKDPRITGTNSQVASGTFAVKSGATLAIEAGAFFTLAAALPLNYGGTGAALADPGADRIMFWDDSAGAVDWLSLGSQLSISGTTLNVSAAPVDATYITQTSNATLTAEQALSGLATGLVQVTTATGVLSSVTTSAGVSGLLSDETGSGALVFGTSPTITTPTISGAVTWPTGVRQTFAPDATSAGLNVGSVAGDPSTPSNGDLWYDSTANELTARINGVSVALGGAGIGGGTGSTDNVILRSDGTGGSTMQGGGVVTLSDSGQFTFPAGVKQTFAPDSTTAGFNVGSVAGDPSTPSNGDLWYDSTANELTARINGTNVALGAGGGGSVSTDTIWDAKGDLAVGTGSNTASKLAVGSNGQVLVADSAESTGLKWATVSGTGDVVGPASSTDARLALFDSTTGKLIKQSTALTESGGTITSNTAIGLTAGGTNQNITLTPSGTGDVRAVNKLYVGTGSVAFSGNQSLIIARDGDTYGGALGVHHGNNPTNNFAWTFQRARGTLASPSAVQNGDRLGQFTFAGWHGSGYSNSAAIVADATENFSTNRGVQVTFETIPTGSSSRSAALRIDGSQNLLLKNGINVGGGSLSGGTTVKQILSASSALNYGSIAAGSEATLTITVTGASTTDTPAVSLGFSAALEDGIIVKQAWVSASNTVSVRVANVSGGAIDPASVTVRATVMSF